jgi:hypothetical protein
VNVVVVLPVPDRPTISADAVAAVRRDDLAAGVEREAAAVVDELVPHPQAALLRLAEVVGVEDARDVVLEVDAISRSSGLPSAFEVRRVDDRQLGLEALELRLGGRVVELLLHRGDVRVRLLDDEARRRRGTRDRCRCSPR